MDGWRNTFSRHLDPLGHGGLFTDKLCKLVDYVWWPSRIPFGNVTSAPENYEGTCTDYYYCNIILPMNTMFCSLIAGNWSDGLREILRYCYGLNPETFVQEDSQDSRADTSVLPGHSPHPGIHLRVGSCQIFTAG